MFETSLFFLSSSLTTISNNLIFCVLQEKLKDIHLYQRETMLQEDQTFFLFHIMYTK
jgi:hypothetical protein